MIDEFDISDESDSGMEALGGPGIHNLEASISNFSGMIETTLGQLKTLSALVEKQAFVINKLVVNAGLKKIRCDCPATGSCSTCGGLGFVLEDESGASYGGTSPL